MSELRELYQQVILDHNKHPRHFHEMDDATRRAEGFNPLCGDKLSLFLKMDEQGKIADASFQGEGCAISIASASLMTDKIIGLTLEEAKALFAKIHVYLTQENAAPTAELGKLEVLGGVKEFPMRVKCATLAWHTLESALEESAQAACTE